MFAPDYVRASHQLKLNIPLLKSFKKYYCWNCLLVYAFKRSAVYNDMIDKYLYLVTKTHITGGHLKSGQQFKLTFLPYYGTQVVISP